VRTDLTNLMAAIFPQVIHLCDVVAWRRVCWGDLRCEVEGLGGLRLGRRNNITYYGGTGQTHSSEQW